MNEQGAYGGKLGQAFRQLNASSLVCYVLRKSAMAITELRCDQANFGRTANITREDAYLVGLQLRACLDHDLYSDGCPVRPINWSAGALAPFDLRSDPEADIRDSFYCLMFYLPHTALKTVVRQEGVPHKGEVKYDTRATSLKRSGRRWKLVLALGEGWCVPDFYQLLLTDLPVTPQLSAQTPPATVIINADASDSTYERTADASFCKSCLATIAQ